MPRPGMACWLRSSSIWKHVLHGRRCISCEPDLAMPAGAGAHQSAAGHGGPGEGQAEHDAADPVAGPAAGVLQYLGLCGLRQTRPIIRSQPCDVTLSVFALVAPSTQTTEHSARVAKVTQPTRPLIKAHGNWLRDIIMTRARYTQAMAGSAYKDSALGDSVKVLNPIEELITSFGTGQPMVFQVRLLVHHFCT